MSNAQVYKKSRNHYIIFPDVPPDVPNWVPTKQEWNPNTLNSIMFAVNAIKSSGDPGCIELLAGVYFVVSSEVSGLNIDNVHGLTISGVPNKTILLAVLNSPTSRVFFTLNNSSNISIYNTKFDYKKNYTQLSGYLFMFEITNCNNIYLNNLSCNRPSVTYSTVNLRLFFTLGLHNINNIDIINCDLNISALNINAYDIVNNFRIMNNRLKDNWNAPTIMIRGHLEDVTISNNIIEYSQLAIEIIESKTASIYNNTIFGNSSSVPQTGITGGRVPSQPSGNIYITNNLIVNSNRNSGSYGLYILSHSDYAFIEGNIIHFSRDNMVLAPNTKCINNFFINCQNPLQIGPNSISNNEVL